MTSPVWSGPSLDVTAAVLRGPTETFSVEQVRLEEPRPNELLVRVEAAGMCHTDLAMRHPLPNRPSPLPAVLGHEGAGVVEAVGSQVASVAVGDHVLLSYDSCGGCALCLAGEPYYCEQFFGYNNSCRRPDGSTGIKAADGVDIGSRWAGQSSLATYAVANERNTVVIDKDLPLATLAPLGCGVQTGAGAVLLALGVGVGARVAVFGAGAVGLSAVMAAAVAGATTIVAVDLNARRLALAQECGATHVFDGADPDLAQQIRSTVGQVDYVVDTTAVASIIEAAIGLLAPRGSAALVGVGSERFSVAAPMLLGRTVTFVLEGNAVPQLFLPKLVNLWRCGRFPIDKLITTYPLDQIDAAERDVAAGTVVKPVLLPWAR